MDFSKGPSPNENSRLLESSTDENRWKDAKGNASLVDPALNETPREVNGNIATSIQVTNTMIGSGILAFPYTLAIVGAFWSFILMIVFGVAVYLTSMFLIKAGEARGLFDFSKLVEHEFGPTARNVFNVSVTLSNLGALLSYMNTIGTLGSDTVKEWGWTGFMSTYGGFMIIVVGVVEAPLCLIRAYGELTWISFGSLAFIMFTIFFVAIAGQDEANHFHWPRMWPDSSLDVLQQLGTFAYAYSCQYVLFEAYVAMTPEAKKNVDWTVFGSVVWGGTLLTLMAIFGYGAFGQDCASDILASFDASSGGAQVAMLVVVLHLLCYIPNDFIIMRLFALSIFKINPLTMPFSTYATVTFFLFGIPLVLMASVPEEDALGAFSLIIDLSGDIPIGFCAFFMPCACYISVFNDDRNNWWYMAWALLALSVVLMVVCPIADISTFMEACNSKEGCSSF